MSNNPWIIKKLVLPQHTDHAGVMWHGSYLNWLEEARVDALEKVGLSYSTLSNEGFELPVVELNIKYKKSLNHGDQVLLKSWQLNREGIRILWKTIFIKSDGTSSAESIVSLVLIERINFNFRIVRQVPLKISESIAALQKGPI